MGQVIDINVPLDQITVGELKAGDEVSLSGRIYTARDQAHLRMCELLKKGQELPIDIEGEIIYYCGPTPGTGGVIGSCGPTTSSRMDGFTVPLLEKGLKGMIGKGTRSREVIKGVAEHKAVYFVAPAGAGAYLSSKVISCKVVAFADLGPEAIHELVVEKMPLIVACDGNGGYIYERFDL
ncbi:MAG: FumA C-terminus/TtdB family hydratase beta subunit [Candidatus Omnitrophica bacterium]|nr:FumA C-terminus/TtdB family hydratase beta subunit [Candidatus Omnitrophota bacterium]MDD5488936.1 FumA C-terminus/TtdB family hydratase beta subunit [Candidatus Omnitrophota bacterium]